MASPNPSPLHEPSSFMASPSPSLLDQLCNMILTWQVRLLMKSIQAGDKAKATQRRLKIGWLLNIMNQRRLYRETTRKIDKTSFRIFLREQSECLREFAAELGLGEAPISPEKLKILRSMR